MPATQELRIEMPYAVYGITVVNGKVTEAAPIAYWMIGKDWECIAKWVKKKGGQYGKQ